MGFLLTAFRTSLFSSSKRGPASRSNPLNNNSSDTSRPAIGCETEMQHEGMTVRSFGCFGLKATRQTPCDGKKGKKTKPLAIIRKFLKRKSESNSPKILLLQDTCAEEAQSPAESCSQNNVLVSGPVDPCIGEFHAIVDIENTNRETEEKSPLTVSSAHACEAVTFDVKEGDHESATAGNEGTCAPEILSVVPSLQKENDEKTENHVPGNSLVQTCSTVADKDEESSNSPLTRSSVEDQGIVGSTSEAQNCKPRVLMKRKCAVV